MPREIAIFNLLLPSLALVLLGCGGVFVLFDLGLARVGLYRHVWHPALFRLSIFIGLFSTMGLLLQPWH